MAKRWYVLHVFSGSEKKVAQLITEQAESHSLDHQIEEVMVPTEDVVEVRRGVRVESERKFFPGYILVKMELTDEAWQLVASLLNGEASDDKPEGANAQPSRQQHADQIIQGMFDEL